MTSKGKSVLVTGAAGFIGSHLVEELVRNGSTVIGFDVFDDYYDPALKERNLAEVQDSDIFHLVRGDIRDKDLVSKTFNEWDIGTVVHLAAMVGVRNSMTNPDLYTSVNVGGTGVILEVSFKQDIDKFILASSSSVYGDREVVPFRETDFTDTPGSIYAATKKAAEVLSFSYHRLYGIPTACLRFFTVYGPRGRPDQAPLKFIHRISNDMPIQQYGDGNSSRDYTYVTDIVSGIVGAIEAVYEYEIFNLGNSTPVKLIDFIKALEIQIGKAANIEKLSNQPGDVFQTLADIGKSKKMLGYEPKVTLNEGLKRMIQWYNETRPSL
ncbi:MAG: GDP-mannose 4,6-dehydratase [Candidatus Thorarchaeota archaeon]